jgi:hypothetical protein
MPAAGQAPRWDRGIPPPERAEHHEECRKMAYLQRIIHSFVSLSLSLSLRICGHWFVYIHGDWFVYTTGID